MIRFDRKKFVDNLNGTLNLRPQINKIIDSINQKGYQNVCWLGIGGTYASAMQAVSHMKEKSAIETFAQHAAEYLTAENRRIGKDTLVVISSVSGTTEEVVKAVNKVHEAGATVLGFVDKPDSTLTKLVDHCITFPLNEQLKFWMVADRLMYNAGEFPDYNNFYQQMEAHFAEDMARINEESDDFAAAFAEKHHEDRIHYFVAAGNQWGATYSYSMCYWDEQHWLPAQAIEAGEFFHGFFEIVTRDTPVTVFIGEDLERPLSERVAKFLPRICANYELIDSRDYDLPGFDEKYRGNLSLFVFRQINNRIDAHIEHINRHPMDIRRYYRQLSY